MNTVESQQHTAVKKVNDRKHKQSALAVQSTVHFLFLARLTELHKIPLYFEKCDLNAVGEAMQLVNNLDKH